MMCSLRLSKHLSIFLERVTGCPSIVFCEVGVKESFSYNRKLELQLDLNLELLANHYFSHGRYLHYLRNTYYPWWNFCRITWKCIHLILQFVILIWEINCSCINQQLILHCTRREYVSGYKDD